MGWVATVSVEDIPLGSCREVPIPDGTVLLVRTGQGVYACAPYCPHKAMNLEAGTVEGTKLTCPLHAATFELETGRPEDETDWAGQLPVFPVRLVEGVVHVDVP